MLLTGSQHFFRSIDPVGIDSSKRDTFKRREQNHSNTSCSLIGSLYNLLERILQRGGQEGYSGHGAVVRVRVRVRVREA